MPVVTWTVIDATGKGPIAQAQITVTGQPQQGFPYFRIDLWTDQFGMASADLMGSIAGMFYDVEISHPDYKSSTRRIHVRGWDLRYDEHLYPVTTPSYTMTFQVTDAVSKENVKEATVTSTFFTVVTDGIGRASVTYQDDKVGEHTVQCVHPDYGSWEGTIHFPPASALRGIELQPIEKPSDHAIGMTDQERLAMAILAAYATMQASKIVEGIIPG